MAISDQQGWDGEDSFELFRVAMGEVAAPYFTEAVAEHNTDVIAAHALKIIPGGISSAKNQGWWEIGFKQCLALGMLKRDPSWKSQFQKQKEFTEFYQALPAEVARVIYEGKLIQYNDNFLSDEQKAALNKIGGPVAFKRFVDAPPKEGV